jgi:hypothetical protein
MSEPLHSVEKDAPTCVLCGRRIEERYAGTFWKEPDPMPTAWYHIDTNARACGYAEPRPLPPEAAPEATAVDGEPADSTGGPVPPSTAVAAGTRLLPPDGGSSYREVVESLDPVWTSWDRRTPPGE